MDSIKSANFQTQLCTDSCAYVSRAAVLLFVLRMLDKYSIFFFYNCIVKMKLFCNQKHNAVTTSFSSADNMHGCAGKKC